MTVSTLAELLGAIDTALATDPATDWTIYLQDGIYGSDGTTAIQGKVFSGTVTDPNLALPIASRDPDARAAVSGGSVTIRAVNKYGAKIAAWIECQGSGPFVWQGIDFIGKATSDQGEISPGNTNLTQILKFQLDHMTNGTYPTLTGNIVRDCRFGGRASGTPPTRYIAAVSLDFTTSALSVVEDCELDGFTIGAKAQVTRRTTFWQQAVDGIRVAFGAGVNAPRHIYGCTIGNESRDPVWTYAHTDAIQIGGQNTNQPIWIEIYDNVIQGEFGMHAIYMDDTASTISGVVQDNLIVCSNQHGITIWHPDALEVRRNIVVMWPDGVISDTVQIPRIRGASAGVVPYSVLIEDCVSHGFTSTAGVVTAVNNELLATTGDDFNRVFTGPFTGGSGYPVAAVDLTSPATMKADLQRLFERR